jgi:hypothetical protein
VIPAALVTHTAVVSRQGTRTSAAGDTVTDGDPEPVRGGRHPCVAEQVSGGTDAIVQRARWRATWHVSFDPGADVQVRDQVELIDLAGGGSRTVTVVEVRTFSRPAQVAHVWARCEEVNG